MGRTSRHEKSEKKEQQKPTTNNLTETITPQNMDPRGNQPPTHSEDTRQTGRHKEHQETKTIKTRNDNRRPKTHHRLAQTTTKTLLNGKKTTEGQRKETKKTPRNELSWKKTKE